MSWRVATFMSLLLVSNVIAWPPTEECYAWLEGVDDWVAYEEPNASPETQLQVRKNLATMGYEYPEKVSVKVGRKPMTTFRTVFLPEPFPPNLVQKFVCSHEAAHCYFHHEAKAVLVLGAAAIPCWLYLGLWGTPVVLSLLHKALRRRYEKEADIEAARALCIRGFREAVEQERNMCLQYADDTDSQGFWCVPWRVFSKPSLKERYRYLGAVLMERPTR